MDELEQIGEQVKEIEMAHASYPAKMAEIKANRIWSEAAKATQLGKLAEWYTLDVIEKREHALQVLERLMTTDESELVDLHDATEIAPRDAAQWAEASARAAFVREDLQHTDPKSIGAMFEKAIKRKDIPGAYLYARYGQEAMKADKDAAHAFEETVRRATESRLDAGKVKEVQARLNRATELQGRLAAIRLIQIKA